MFWVRQNKYKIIITLIFVLLTSISTVTGHKAFKKAKKERVMVSTVYEGSPIEQESAKAIIKKYEKLDYQEDMILAKDIEKSTPLDFDTSRIIVAHARKFNIKPSLILAMIDLESNFDQYCVGTHEDRGYLQIIPGTEKWLAEKFKEELNIEYNPERIFEPEYNIGLGTAYISLLSSAYGSDIDRILSEYNRGPYKLKKFYEKYNTYKTAYSQNILSREEKYKHLNR